MKFENSQELFQRRQSKFNFRKRKPARNMQNDSNKEDATNLMEMLLNLILKLQPEMEQNQAVSNQSE